MSVYMTEAEQLEVIKKWWKKYNNVIIILFSVILLVISGYKYWNWHQEKIIQQASSTYEQLMISFSNHDNRSVRGYANQLINDYDKTIYADAARLTLAKLYVLREKYAKAEEELKYVAINSTMPSLKQIAKIRMARLLATQKLYDRALQELSSVESSVYIPVINELKGDIYAADGQYQSAVESYRMAIKEAQVNGMGNLFLEMKTNELTALTQSMKVRDTKIKTV